MSLLGYRRHTPTSTAALTSTGGVSPLPDGRAAIGRLRALATLVSRLSVVGGGRAIMEAPPAQQQAVREAVRDFASRMREEGMQCRLLDGQFVLAGAPLPRDATQADPMLADLLARCQALRVGGIIIRQGASPGELLLLATALIRSPTPVDGVPAVTSAGDPNPPRELLRSWSVVVTTGQVESTTRRPSFADGIAALTAEADPHASQAAQGLAALAAAKTIAASEAAATQVIAEIDAATSRRDATVLDGIVRTTVAHLHAVGDGGGRLATERILRHLQRRPMLELLAQLLPRMADRTPVLELLARAGDVAIELLVTLLMDAEDPPSRRAYFDSIVALDLGGTRVVALLRDPRWFVVRNAMALLGDMGVEPADEALLPFLQHQDDRLRVAAARSLLRLGTAKAMHALHGAIDDRHPEVRRLAATSYALSGGLGIRPPAVRLAAAFERETEEDVALEMLAALGRLGSADAIQRLLRIALPSTGDADGGTREPYLRIAALESLVKARGGAAQVAIEQLVKDPDPQVAAAAQRLRG